MEPDSLRALAARHTSLCLLVVLAACGGGGGGGEIVVPLSPTPPPPPAATFSASFSPPSIQASTIAGYVDAEPYTAVLSYDGKTDIYLAGDADKNIVWSVSGNVGGNALTGTITFRSDLAPGTYTTQYQVHACLDQACSSEVQGSPASVPVTLVVKPNIEVQQNQLNLTRTGADPAPTATDPVTIPAEAGTVTMTAQGPASVFTASFDGQAIHVATNQVRAGTYSLQLALQGSSDPRYTRTVSVGYTVNPPPGGEQVLAMTPTSANLVVTEGGSQSLPFTVTAPTWTSSPVTVTLKDSTGMLRLADLGSNAYRVDLDASSALPGMYSADVLASAGATGGQVRSRISWLVSSSFYATGNFNTVLDATSQPSALQLSGSVVTVDGVQSTWLASSMSNWFQVAPDSGTTGVDPLQVLIDPAFGGADDPGYAGSLSLTIDRAGASPQSVSVSVYNNIPELARSVAVLSGTAGRVYVDGFIPSIASQLLASGSLHVTGATLAGASYRDDRRFVGTVSLLALDLTGATPGTPITVSVETPLASSQVTIAVEAPVQVAPDFASLPYGAYRPGVYAAGLDAFYFSAPGSVYRWAATGAQRSLAQAGVDGVTGLALRQDEQQLYVVAGSSLLRLDPATLVQTAASPPLTDGSGRAGPQFDANVAANLSTVVFASDGRAIASTLPAAGSPDLRGAYWIHSASTSRRLADLSTAPRIADPGEGNWASGASDSGVGLASSPSHHVIVGTDAAGDVSVYQASLARWNPGPRLPAGTTIVAVDDLAARMVRSDGIVLDAGAPSGNLSSVVPLTYQAGGYGLTQDGRYGLVYGYQTNPANGAQPASHGTLWVVDLSQSPLSTGAIVDTIALASPVGCTAAMLADGETCLHQAAIVVAPGSASAFVLGPRGVAAVALPAGVQVTGAAAGARAQALARTAPPETPIAQWPAARWRLAR